MALEIVFWLAMVRFLRGLKIDTDLTDIDYYLQYYIYKVQLYYEYDTFCSRPITL